LIVEDQGATAVAKLSPIAAGGVGNASRHRASSKPPVLKTRAL
jgi:hypothetical protein